MNRFDANVLLRTDLKAGPALRPIAPGYRIRRRANVPPARAAGGERVSCSHRVSRAALVSVWEPANCGASLLTG
jgi:hypothetical protein